MDERRKQYFIKGPLQGRYLRLLVLSMMVPTVIVTGCLYYLMFTLTANQIAFPDAVAQHLFPVLKKINWILFIGLPLIFAVIFAYGVLISHRMAGPIYRLEEDLDKIAAGDFSRRVKFRTKDRMDSLAEKMNRVLEKLPR